MNQYTLVPDQPIQVHLLQGCCLEAERADRVALGLDGLRLTLSEEFHGHMVAVSEEIRRSSRLLRELADRSQVQVARASLVLDHLNVFLPCFSRTLRDITGFYDNKTFSREIRWRKMYHDMAKEAGGLPLPQRFLLYNDYLTLLMQLLLKSPTFELNRLDAYRARIMDLREKRGIPAPAQIAGPLVPREPLVIPTLDRNTHWAEQIFSLPLPSRTDLGHVKSSKVYPPFTVDVHGSIPPGSTLLFWRPFDNDRLSVMALLNSQNNCPYLLIRAHDAGVPLFSVRGAHEICVSRVDNSLHLKRWSARAHASKLWALLYFLTWEEMVLFYCTFVALKARDPLTVQINPREYKLHGEKRLFQAQIIDDEYSHSLIVYEDEHTHGIRLHAAVWEGELRQCPVWTAFVTHQSASPTWLQSRGKHRIWLKDIKLYVFCQKYREENMRHNKTGAFEIYFYAEEAAQRFKEVFYPTSTPESSDANGPGVSPPPQ